MTYYAEALRDGSFLLDEDSPDPLPFFTSIFWTNYFTILNIQSIFNFSVFCLYLFTVGVFKSGTK